MRRVELTASAKADFVVAFVWYEHEQTGLGEAFRRSVQAAQSLVARRPEGFPAVDARFKKAVLRRYPYILVFDFDDECVIVHAIFHTAQKPSKLRTRLRKP